MKKIIGLIFLLLCVTQARAQISRPTLILTADPTGACPNGRLAVNITDFTLFYCSGSIWNAVTSGTSGGSVLPAQLPDFLTGTSGSDFNIQKDVETVTFNLPSAACEVRGVVDGEPQIFCGPKSFQDSVTLPSLDIFGDNAYLMLSETDCVDVTPVAGENIFCSDLTTGLIHVINERGTTVLGGDIPIESSQNGLISGGSVAWSSGLIFTVQAATYQLSGNPYTSSMTNVTLAVADGAQDRIDLVIVDDTSTATKITGTPGTPPAAPTADPESEIALTFAYVAAGATEPSNIVQEDIYLEDTEWPCTESDGSSNCASTTNPYAGTKDINFTNATPGDNVRLVRASAISLSTYSNLVFYIRPKATWNRRRSLVLQWYNSTALVGLPITLNDGAYGFSSSTLSYQQISVPIPHFAASGNVDQLRFTVAGAGGSSIGFYLDNVVLQGGIAPPPTVESFPYDVGTYFPGVPGSSEILARVTFVRNVSFPANLANSQGTAETAATAETIVIIEKNGTEFGTCTFAIAGTTCTFASPVGSTFTSGDVLTLIGPASADVTLADISITLAGTR